MSRLEELIAELCPDGVEYKPLSALADIGTGSHNTNEELEEGDYPFFVRSQDVRRLNTYDYDEKAIITSGDGVGVGKIFHLIEGKYALHQRAYRIHITDENLLSEFFFHYMKATFYEYIQKTAFNSSVTSIRRPMINNYPVPVPPLDVQREIVRILDNFTELTAELTAELSLRKKQYEYYRKKLLDFDDSLPQYTLGNLANSFRGDYITKKSTKPGKIPVILGGQEPAYFIDKFNHDGEIVVIARSGASAGFVSYWNEPIFVTDGFGYEAKEEIITSKFLYYLLKNREKELNNMKRGAGVPHVSGEALSKLVFSVPSIDVQRHITKIIEYFDALCCDISEGLPAEIEARQKQYEYYRDKLLTFKPLTA